MMVETYLRRGQRELQRLALDPKVRGVGAVMAYGGSGFLLSAAVAVLSAGVSVLYIGCTKDERQDIYTYLRKLIRK